MSFKATNVSALTIINRLLESSFMKTMLILEANNDRTCVIFTEGKMSNSRLTGGAYV